MSWEDDPPTSKQIDAMDTIVYYLPDLEEEREKCTTKGKASRFIGKYQEESYKARDEVKRLAIYGFSIDSMGDTHYNGWDEELYYNDEFYDSEEW